MLQYAKVTDFSDVQDEVKT